MKIRVTYFRDRVKEDGSIILWPVRPEFLPTANSPTNNGNSSALFFRAHQTSNHAMANQASLSSDYQLTGE